MRIQKRDKLRAFYQKKREDREAAYAKERAQRAIKDKEDARARAEMAKLDAEIIEEDEHFSQTGKGRGKRKRASTDSDGEPAAEEPRTSARLNDTRSSERSGRRNKALFAPTRRSTRNPGPMIASGLPGDEDWQQIPAEWLKSEEQEKDEDPDFGALQTKEHISEESDHDEMLVDESDSDAPTNKPRRRGPGRPRKAENEIMSRRSPRKSRPARNRIQSNEDDDEEGVSMAHHPDPFGSDLSDLSDLADDVDDDEDNDSDEERIASAAKRKGHYPDSMYEIGPTFDDEDSNLPHGFVRWEAVSWLERISVA